VAAAGGAPLAVIDLPAHAAAARFLCVAQRHFAVVDAAGGLTAWAYDGRALPALRPAATLLVRPEGARAASVAVAHDVLAAIDWMDAGGRAGRLWDLRAGRALPSSTIWHGGGEIIAAIALSQGCSGAGSSVHDLHLAYLDASGDVYVVADLLRPQPRKVAMAALDLAWNARCNALAVLSLAPAGLTLAVLLAPAATLGAAADLCAPTLADLATVRVHLPLPGPPRAASRLASFCGARACIDCGDAGLTHAAASTYVQLLHECAAAGDWVAAQRLARLVDQPAMWAALVALAWPGAAPASTGPPPHVQQRLAATAEALARLCLVDTFEAVRAQLQSRAAPRAAGGGEGEVAFA
jgi:hypothetical protein